MDCRLALPAEIKQTKSSLLEDFLDHERDQFYESLYDYRLLKGAIVDDSLTVDGVELEGNKGTVSLSFYEEERSGCRDRDKPAEPTFVHIRFDLTADEIILHFIDNSRPEEPEFQTPTSRFSYGQSVSSDPTGQPTVMKNHPY